MFRVFLQVFGVEKEPVWLGLVAGPDACCPAPAASPAPLNTAAAVPTAVAATPPAPPLSAEDAAKPFPCVHCSKRFATEINLGRHVAKEHAGAAAPEPPPVAETSVSASDAAAAFLGVRVIPTDTTCDIAGMVEVVSFRISTPAAATTDIQPSFHNVSGIIRCLSLMMLSLSSAVMPSVIK